MSRIPWPAILALVALPALAPDVRAQQPYIGFAYPAGGQQGTTFQVSMGGQGVEGVSRVFVSGPGVKARLLEYNKKMNPQEIALLGEQLKELKALPKEKQDAPITNLMSRLQRFIGEYVNQSACSAIANIVVAEVTVAPDAAPGLREIRVGTPRGLSNPLVFAIGQVPEVTPPPAPTTQLAILGKEGQSLRKKPRAGGTAGGADMMMSAMMGSAGAQSDVDDDEVCLTIPCTVNGQITPGSVDRFRFTASKGQRLVVSVQARDLVPYMADAVPGWFQPVVVLSDAKGGEVAYDDDYRFRPDPVILCEIPVDGEYRLAIHDAIFRGREDFVYRMTVGEIPFVTSIFPLGGPVGTATPVEVKGWNLAETKLTAPTNIPVPGVRTIAADGKDGRLSNRVPFAQDILPECMEKEPNSQRRTAQRVTLPVIVNGRADKPGDRDVYQFEGRAGDEIVAEIVARRLDSPLDSVIKLTDASDRILALNDDLEDAGSGLNTHHADSYLRATLPTNGTFYVHVADTQHEGGEAYAYRLRISAPQPDFALRVVPSALLLRTNLPSTVSVHLIRRDGFTGPIKLGLKAPPPGFEMVAATMTGTQTMMRVTVKTTLPETAEPVCLTIAGTATNLEQTIVRDAVPAEDRMQAFLWRHLVPAQELKALVVLPPPPPPKPDAPKPAAVAPTPAAKKT